ncbi:hypothetical protein BpHYR1_022921 [Brachionus plicatilis]|uniref:Uncharacterized protein n=1 Tax=Brachionus plicatilis TaxID=10195 RepID=A0A3M7T619_BRAPC|nr:hypothetical protein BpHYR1_022921 [Brachionus plicatilis]
MLNTIAITLKGINLHQPLENIPNEPAKKQNGISPKFKEIIDELLYRNISRPYKIYQDILLNNYNDHARPSLFQIQNYLKYYRKKNGDVNSIVGLEELVKPKLFTNLELKTYALDKPIYFGSEIMDGDENNHFHLGITSKQLLKNVYDGCTFNTDCTYKIVKYGFPVLVFVCTEIRRKFFQYFNNHNVLFNKHANKIPKVHQESVVDDIIHFRSTKTQESIETKIKNILSKWNKLRGLKPFLKYFKKRWINSPLRNWQICNTPADRKKFNLLPVFEIFEKVVMLESRESLDCYICHDRYSVEINTECMCPNCTDYSSMYTFNSMLYVYVSFTLFMASRQAFTSLTNWYNDVDCILPVLKLFLPHWCRNALPIILIKEGHTKNI